jgi:formate hydrogenlyase subunit 3/multisubunit Na+/H+ antiporter MnhD subunit
VLSVLFAKTDASLEETEIVYKMLTLHAPLLFLLTAVFLYGIIREKNVQKVAIYVNLRRKEQDKPYEETLETAVLGFSRFHVAVPGSLWQWK